jgi:hypothetical protein
MMSPSLLDGPGSQYLKLETRVRIPLGTPGRFADLWFTSGDHASGGVCPCSRGTRLKHTKLEAQVRLLAGAPQEGTVPSEAHNLGAVGSIPAPASRGASRRAAALIRLSLEVRFLPSRLIWVWLNLAEHRFRAPAIGGSNPPTQTDLAVHSLGVAQSGRAPVRGTGDWGFESLHPDLWISRSGLDGTVT